MSTEDPAERESALVGQIAAVFEHAGFAPIAGRILGHLMLCEPAHQSSTQLAESLEASKGAISTSTRMLMAAGLVERVRFPKDRASYFRMHKGCWNEMIHAEALRIQRLRRIGDEALAYLEQIGADASRAERLREFRDINAFFESEFPALLARWDARSET
ncbi:MAG: ArsR family transcriptional regulator [Proteobacteria bacterium]|nr:ArsR family transcriptional regulator [Pseudomonadota bacterium]